MKRTLCMILAAMLILTSASLFACNGNNDETPGNDPSSKLTAGPTEEPTEESTEEPTETPVPEAYEPKDEYERLVIDFLDCVNRGDLEAWTELFVPNEREYKKQALEQKTIDIIYVERFDVHFMTQVDSFAALRIFPTSILVDIPALHANKIFFIVIPSININHLCISGAALRSAH